MEGARPSTQTTHQLLCVLMFKRSLDEFHTKIWKDGKIQTYEYLFGESYNIIKQSM